MSITIIGLILGLLMGGCAEESELESAKRLAIDGDASAQYNLGVMYMNGTGVLQDYKEAVKWYRLSAEQGNALGQYNLGVMYMNGIGVPQDYKEAVRWYRMSAEQGDAMAQYNLGVMYKNGEGVLQDYKESYAWSSLAKANGKELAEKILGIVTKEMTKEQIAEAQSLATEIQKQIEANRKD